MIVCIPVIIIAELDDGQQRLSVDVELNHPYLPILIGGEVTIIRNQKADDVWVLQGHHGALEICSRKALVSWKRPDLLAVDLSVFHPRQWRLHIHAEIHRPGRDSEGEARVRTCAPARATTAAVGADADKPHFASPHGAHLQGILQAKHVVVLIVVTDIVIGAAAAAHLSGHRYIAHLGARLVSHVAQEEAVLVVDPA